MKYRKGFVTNSSSSSYICEVCGSVEGGYDIGLSDVDMVECEYGHTFCNCHLITPNKKQKLNYLKKKSKKSFTIPLDTISEEKLDELLEEVGISEDNDYDIYEYPSLFCPLCNLEHISDEMKLSYLLKAVNKKETDLAKEILSQFEDLDALNAYLDDPLT